MIDVNKETLITFQQLARRLPARRGLRPVHVSTIHRWRATGVRGVRIEAIRLGGSWVTSIEAMQRFVVALTSVSDGQTTSQHDSVRFVQPDNGVQATLAERFGL